MNTRFLQVAVSFAGGTTNPSWIRAMSLRGPPRCGQVSTSIAKTRPRA
jgi:hypothetical protein